MTKPELTLANVRNTAKVKTFRASDFLSDDQLEEVHTSNLKGRKKGKFDAIDAYIAEIIARFGYETYKAWACGEIDELKMARLVEAERAREAKQRLILENIIVASVAGANRPTKGGHTPKSLSAALKMLKNEQKLAKGDK